MLGSGAEGAGGREAGGRWEQMGRWRVEAPGRGRSRGEARGGGPALEPRGGIAGGERLGFDGDGKRDGLAG